MILNVFSRPTEKTTLWSMSNDFNEFNLKSAHILRNDNTYRNLHHRN